MKFLVPESLPVSLLRSVVAALRVPRCGVCAVCALALRVAVRRVLIVLRVEYKDSSINIITRQSLLGCAEPVVMRTTKS